MKKFCMCFLAFCLVVGLFALVGCDGKKKTPVNTGEPQTTVQESEPTQPDTDGADKPSVPTQEQETDPDGGLWSPKV